MYKNNVFNSDFVKKIWIFKYYTREKTKEIEEHFSLAS